MNNKVVKNFIEKNILNILRCEKKCICYQHFTNGHIKLTETQENELYKSYQKNNINNNTVKWCFTDYDGTNQFKKFIKRT